MHSRVLVLNDFLKSSRKSQIIKNITNFAPEKKDGEEYFSRPE
jgi:hypothetical protein